MKEVLMVLKYAWQKNFLSLQLSNDKYGKERDFKMALRMLMNGLICNQEVCNNL